MIARSAGDPGAAPQLLAVTGRGMRDPGETRRKRWRDATDGRTVVRMRR